MDETFLTVTEIADLLKVNQQTVRNWIDRGALRVVRVGQRRVRIRESDLHRFLAESADQHSREFLGPAPTDDPPPQKQRRPRESPASSLADAFRTAAAAGRPELTAALRTLAVAADQLADELESQNERRRRGRKG
jgi:excisionase family DNA binding protein